LLIASRLAAGILWSLIQQR